MDTGRVTIGNDTSRQYVGRLLLVIHTADNRVVSPTVPSRIEHVVFPGTNSIGINENDRIEMYFKPYEAPQVGYINLLTRAGFSSPSTVADVMRASRSNNPLAGYIFYHNSSHLSINERTIQKFVKCEQNKSGSCYLFHECSEIPQTSQTLPITHTHSVTHTHPYQIHTPILPVTQTQIAYGTL